MKTPKHDESLIAIDELISKAKQTANAVDAMQYAQAACTIANTISALHNADRSPV